MLDLTVLVVLRDLRLALDQLLPDLCRQLPSLASRAEIVCVNGVGLATRSQMEDLARFDPRIRLLNIDPSLGPSVAISAGIAAARGETISAIEGTGRYAIAELSRLLPRLTRADAVFGCRRRGAIGRLKRSLISVPRRWITGVDLRDPGCLLWAARREAVEGIELFPGTWPLLSGLIAKRGYRVSELHVDHDQRAARLDDRRSLAALFYRRPPAFTVHEFAPSSSRVAA